MAIIKDDLPRWKKVCVVTLMLYTISETYSRPIRRTIRRGLTFISVNKSGHTEIGINSPDGCYVHEQK